MRRLKLTDAVEARNERRIISTDDHAEFVAAPHNSYEALDALSLATAPMTLAGVRAFQENGGGNFRSFKTKDGIKIKFHDKLSALDKIGRHLGMFVEKHELTGKDGGPIETADVSDLDRARTIAFALEKGRRILERNAEPPEGD